MQEGVIVAPEKIMEALKEEKVQLEKMLETLTDEPEKQKILNRLTEINAYLALPSTSDPEVTELPCEPVVELRRSERESKPTEKKRGFMNSTVHKREKKFLSLYNDFKMEVQLVRIKLKEECTKDLMEERILHLEQLEADLKNEYDELRKLKTPSPDNQEKNRFMCLSK